MSAGWTHYVLERYLAPQMGSLKSLSAREISIDANLFAINMLNSTLIVQWPEQLRVLNGILIRRTTTAVRRYNDFVSRFSEYITRKNSGEQVNLIFLGSLDHLEESLIQSQIAIMTLSAIGKYFSGPSVFIRKDRSIADRLVSIANRIKHFDQDVSSSRGVPNFHCTPVWVSDDEIKSNKTSLKFEEYEEILNDLLDNCKFIAIEAPKKIHELSRYSPLD